jgi:hypothetical protein
MKQVPQSTFIHRARSKEALNVPRTRAIEAAFEPMDPLEFLDTEENEEYQHESWLFGARNL